MTATITEPNATEQRQIQPQPRRKAPKALPSKKWFIVGVVALLAFIANLVAVRSMTHTDKIVVAAADTLAGTPLAEVSLDNASARLDAGTLDAVLSVDDTDKLSDHVLTASLSAGDPIPKSLLVAPAAESGLRAMSVPIDPAYAAAGTLVAGDRVDVIEIAGGSPGYVMHAAEVLDVVDADAGGIVTASSSYAVVLAVDSDTALRLAAARDSGSLQLVKSTGSHPDGS